jgi:hypothetical protein
MGGGKSQTLMVAVGPEEAELENRGKQGKQGK